MSKHPYIKFESMRAWEVLDKSIDDLIHNDDLEPKTSKQYIIGYIMKMLSENGCLNEDEE